MSYILHDRYEIIGELGTGGMSQVYLCVDNHIGKKWAVKKINCSKQNIKLIESEISTLKALDYPLFPRITDAWIGQGSVTGDSSYYIVTDYIDGVSLDKVLKTRQVLPESTVIKYVNDLANALKFLHCQSPPILYLDMKPSNIMVKKDGSIMLIDFGIAQRKIEESRNLGTRGYAAPEQYIKGEALTEKSDVFSLGMTIFSMLTGKKPDGNYDWQLVNLENSRIISKRMKKLIKGCIEYDPNKRLSIEEVISSVNHIRGTDRGIKVAGFMLSMVAMMFVLSTKIIADVNIKKEDREVSKQMVEEISKHIENGEYTKEGIRIICGYLDGNFLDKKSEEYFTYEVAMNLFEVQRDYTEAKRYFERLNNDDYPEAEYLLKLCKAMTGFDKNKEVQESLSEFVEYNKGVSDEKKRSENNRLIEFISSSLLIQ